MQLQSYASDLLEDAMILAQTKAINSFSFRDMINALTELWGYCYEKIAQIESGYYSRTIRLTQRLTRLPPFVKNTIRVYSSRGQDGYSRRIYKHAGMNDLNAGATYHISGNDLYCRDAELRYVWLEYVPEPPFVSFTKHNREPKILWKPDDPHDKPYGDYTNRLYGMYKLLPDEVDEEFDSQDIRYQETYIFQHRATGATVDRTSAFTREGFSISALLFDHPWMFITFENDVTHEHESFVTQGVLENIPHTRYNPFDYQGRGSNVRYIRAKYNDYTGMGVVVEDHSDGLVKELGWTPDTLLVYPSRIMYNYMVASMAQRFAAMNGSTIMAVELALVQSQDEMGLWMKKNKSAWLRADNVTGPTISDFL